MASKRVLLSGGAGSIGVHTMYHILANTDWHVVIIDSFRHKGLTERITEMLRDHDDYWTRITIVTHDLAQPLGKAVKARIGKIDYVLNLASLSDVEASIKEPVPFMRNNIDLTVNLLEYARQTKPEVFVQFSTDEVYGPSGRDQQHPEWAPILPSNPYAASKACQEAIAISYWRTYGVPVIITNTMNNVSEFQQSSKFPVMVQRAVMLGEKVTIHGTPDDIGTRYYIHSRNASDALLFILKKLPPHKHDQGAIDRPDRYNIVGDKQVDNLSLAKMIAEYMGKELDYEFLDFHSSRPGHDKNYGLTGDKLKKLGWKSPLGFEESIKNVIEWQMAHPEWILVEDHETYDKKRT